MCNIFHVYVNYGNVLKGLQFPTPTLVLEIKEGTYENGKWTLIAKENGNLSKEKGHVSK